MEIQEDNVASGFQAPDPKKALSMRVRGSILARVADIRELWQEKAKCSGLDEEAVEAIDTTYVVERLLAIACDGELEQWGGYAPTKEAKQAQLEAVRAATKKLR